MIEVDLAKARDNMILQQIRPWDVMDYRVLNVMESTPREQFVDPRYTNLAFSDVEIPLAHDQVMMSPKIEARLLQALDIQPSDRILEIGTGSGYLTACLAQLGNRVVSIDLYQDFQDSAKNRLANLGIDNVVFKTGDAAQGWLEDGPFDVIAITASVEQIHPTFFKTLHTNGRLFAVVGEAPAMQAQLITRTGQDTWSTENLFETVLPRLSNCEQPAEFEF